MMDNKLIRSEYCINSFRYTDDYKSSKYFTSIKDNNTIQNIFQILANLNANIDLNDFILLAFYKTKNNLNLTYLEFFKQMILHRYYMCISSNELLKFNLINKSKHLDKHIVKHFRLNKDYVCVDQHMFYIVPEIFKTILSKSTKHKDIYLTYIYLEEYIYFYDKLQQIVLSNKLKEYQKLVSMMNIERRRMETELHTYELAHNAYDSKSDSYESIDDKFADDKYDDIVYRDESFASEHI